jgi:hypothetical protein
MTQIASIGAGMFSDMSVAMSDPYVDPVANFSSEADYKNALALIKTSIEALGTDTFVRIENVREFPSMGTPPNIVNVPVYGQATSQQIQGQSDAPSIELTLNYIAADWAEGTNLGDAVGDGKQYLLRFALLNSEAPYFATDSTNVAAGTSMGGTAAQDIENSMYFWIGKIEALQVNPQLTDSNTATVTISIQSDFFGAYTVDGAG